MRPLRAAGLYVFFAAVLTRPVRLFDADSYLHLALAARIRDHGLSTTTLPWARFSVMGTAFADKELLFHLGLLPFTAAGELGGQLALALLCSVFAWSLWELGERALGAQWAWCIPGLVFCASGSFELRALRLRPELLSITLLVWVVWALVERRYVRAALLACAFGLAHTASHTLLGLAGLYTLLVRYRERRWEWQLLASCSLGVGAAFLVHPQFPNNLRIFWIQNVEFFLRSGQLDSGGEFRAHSALNLLVLDGLWLLGLLWLWAARTPTALAQESANARRMADFSWIAAAVFGALFLRMGRFATLAVPFASLAVAFELRARGFELGPRVGRWSSRAGCAVIAGFSLLNASGTAYVNWRFTGCFDAALSGELAALGARLPDDARVAANWDDAESYVFYAPQARYLNVYDPVFMAVVNPVRYALWMRVLAGAEPDPVRALTRELDSEYVAFMPGAHPQLFDRLSRDPRAHLEQRGAHALFRLLAR